MSFVSEEVSILASSAANAGASNISADGSQFEILLDGEGLSIPKDAVNINITVEEATVWWTTPNITVGVNDTWYVYGDDVATTTPQLWTVTISQGLYDLPGLNIAVQAALEAAGARTVDGSSNPLPLISLEADAATGKVRIRFNYTNVYVDFAPADTCRDIVGFDNIQYGPYAGAPLTVLAPNVAAFNVINYFLIHSDLVNKGIRINNTYSQTIAQVLINVAPGSQIVSAPFNPAKNNAQELAGTKRSKLRFWLTDDSQNSVDTAGEAFTCRLVIHFQRPMVIARLR
jgi:hypothetical protein